VRVTTWLTVAVSVSLVGLATLATADVTCRPNIFGGQDCAGDGTSSSSRPNIAGGYDTTHKNGTRTTSRPNIFGRQDTNGPDGTVTSRPNNGALRKTEAIDISLRSLPPRLGHLRRHGGEPVGNGNR